MKPVAPSARGHGVVWAALALAVLPACFFAPPRPETEDDSLDVAGDGGTDDSPDGGMDDGGIDSGLPCEPSATANLPVVAAIPIGDKDALIRAGHDQSRAVLYSYEGPQPLRSCATHVADLGTSLFTDTRVEAVGRMRSNVLLALVSGTDGAGGTAAIAVQLQLPELTVIGQSMPTPYVRPTAAFGQPTPFIAFAEYEQEAQIWFGASELLVWDLSTPTTPPLRPLLELDNNDELLHVTARATNPIPPFEVVGKLRTYSGAFVNSPTLSAVGGVNRSMECGGAPSMCGFQLVRAVHGGPVHAAGYSSVVARQRSGMIQVRQEDAADWYSAMVGDTNDIILDVAAGELDGGNVAVAADIEVVSIILGPGGTRLQLNPSAFSASPPNALVELIDQNFTRVVVGDFSEAGTAAILVLGAMPGLGALPEKCLELRVGALEECS